MIYYSTGKSPYLPAKGKAVEETNIITAEILLKKGSLVQTLEELEEKVIEKIEIAEVKKVDTTKIYKDSKGKKYTEEQVAKMDKRTGLYKEIMQLSK